MVKSDFHDPLDAKSVNIPHGEVLDPQVLQDAAVTNKLHKHKEVFSWRFHENMNENE